MKTKERVLVAIKHKKTFGFFTFLLILLVGVIIFFDPLLQGGANAFLEDLDPPMRSKVTDVKSDLSEGRVSFSFQTQKEEGKPQLVDVERITLDAGLDFKTDVIVEGTKIQLTKDFLQDFRNSGGSEESNENKDATIPSSLQYLSSFFLKDFSIILVDSGIVMKLDELAMDFEMGLGHVRELIGKRDDPALKIVSVPRVDLRFAEDLTEADKKQISLKIPGPRFAVDQSLIDTVFSYLPEERQAQEAPEEKSSPTDLGKFIDEIVISDLEAKALSKSGDLNFWFENFDLNLVEENLYLRNLSLLLGKTPELLTFDNLRVEFDSSKLLAEDSDLGIQFKGIRAHVQKKTFEMLKSLPRPPESKESKETGNPLKKISFIALDDTRFVYGEKNVELALKEFLLNAKTGNLDLKDLSGSLVSEKKPFLKMKTLNTKFDPQEIGHAPTPEINVTVNDFKVDVSKKLMDTLNSSKSSEKSSPSGPLPIAISRILVGDGRVNFLDFPGVGDQEYLQVQDIFGTIHNITLAPGTPLADFTFNATLEGESKFVVNGKFDMAGDPLQWSLNYRLFDFDMTKLNDELRARVPLTFNDGVLSFYGEAIKRDEKIVGYYKPILDEGDYLGNENEFKGLKHFLIETSATVASWLFERDESNTLATRVPFEIKDGKLDPDVSKAVWNAVEHGFLETDRIEPGVEQKYQLKQAQEEE